MKHIKHQPKKERKLDWHDLPKGFKAIKAKDLKKDQFFFYHLTGQRRVVDEIKKDVLIEIKSTLSNGRSSTHAVIPDKSIIVYQ